MLLFQTRGQGDTVLHQAAAQGDKRAVQLLLEAAARSDIPAAFLLEKRNRRGQTAAEVASELHFYNCAHFIEGFGIGPPTMDREYPSLPDVRFVFLIDRNTIINQ
eukprot:SAG31_NODE_635_length_13360_cov_4.229847_10_plen_105_part_00